MSLSEAYDLVAHAEHLLPRIEAAALELAKYPGLAEEKAWVALAVKRLAAVKEPTGDLLVRALRVPELEPMKGEQSRVLQGAAVDALERLQAGIVYAGGQRSPLLEALYFKLKLPALRRCDREEFEQFCIDFEKRLASSYARRMLGDDSYAGVVPALDGLRRAFATWRSVFVDPPLGEAEAQPLRDELDATARRLDVPCRQARLLAQAALAPLKELGEAAMAALVRKRKGVEAEDTHPVLEQDPPDPSEPTPEERAEVLVVHAETTPT